MPTTKKCNLILQKGDSRELLENKKNEELLFSHINNYVEIVNCKLPTNLQLTLKL